MERLCSNSKRAGPFFLGPQLCKSPVNCITHCLARKDGTNDFYTIKILTKPEPFLCGMTDDDIQGNILVQTEYNLLKQLKGQKRIIQEYGLYKDVAEEEVDIGGKGYLTGRLQTRICLVLDCYMPNDYNRKFKNLMNLQQFVIKEKRLSESLAIKIFYNIVQIVCRLHKQNIVHRDLKLGNVVMDRDTKDVTLTNFGLGKQLVSEDEQLRDQRGSPAYISPAVISGKPYLGKPSDMWALGVVLYTMLYGQFPFYDSSPTELFRKIRLAEFHIPREFAVSQQTLELVFSLLVLDPTKRSTALKTVEKLRSIFESVEPFLVCSNLQVIPTFTIDKSVSKSKLKTVIKSCSFFVDQKNKKKYGQIFD